LEISLPLWGLSIIFSDLKIAGNNNGEHTFALSGEVFSLAAPETP
jgi:hypothetical protein